MELEGQRDSSTRSTSSTRMTPPAWANFGSRRPFKEKTCLTERRRPSQRVPRLDRKRPWSANKVRLVVGDMDSLMYAISRAWVCCPDEPFQLHTIRWLQGRLHHRALVITPVFQDTPTTHMPRQSTAYLANRLTRLRSLLPVVRTASFFELALRTLAQHKA